MRKLKAANSLTATHVTRVNGGKVYYEVRKIVSKKSMLKAGPVRVEWYVFRIQDGWSCAIASSPNKQAAYGHARMCREYGCIY